MLGQDRSDIPPHAVRERLTDAAYPLFAGEGIHDAVTEQSQRAAGVPATEFDSEVASSVNPAEIEAALAPEKPEREWTFGIVTSGAQRRGTTPESRLLAIFDVFDEWFQRDDHEAHTFISVILEMEPEHPSGRSSIVHLDRVRLFVLSLARQAELVDVEEFTQSWHILMQGAIVNAAEGDAGAARRAREMGRDLIARFSPEGLRAGRTKPGVDDDIEWEYEDAMAARRPFVDSSISFEDYH